MRAKGRKGGEAAEWEGHRKGKLQLLKERRATEREKEERERTKQGEKKKGSRERRCFMMTSSLFIEDRQRELDTHSVEG